MWELPGFLTWEVVSGALGPGSLPAASAQSPAFAKERGNLSWLFFFLSLGPPWRGECLLGWEAHWPLTCPGASVSKGTSSLSLRDLLSVGRGGFKLWPSPPTPSPLAALASHPLVSSALPIPGLGPRGPSCRRSCTGSCHPHGAWPRGWQHLGGRVCSHHLERGRHTATWAPPAILPGGG